MFFYVKDVRHTNISTVYSDGASVLFMKPCRPTAKGSGFPVSLSGVFFPKLMIGVFLKSVID